MDLLASKAALVAEKARQIRAEVGSMGSRPRVILGWAVTYSETWVGLPFPGHKDEHGAPATRKVLARKLVCTFTKAKCDEDAWHTLGVIAEKFGMPEKDMDALLGNEDAPRESRRFIALYAPGAPPLTEREEEAVYAAMGYASAEPSPQQKPSFGKWKSTSKKGKR